MVSSLFLSGRIRLGGDAFFSREKTSIACFGVTLTLSIVPSAGCTHEPDPPDDLSDTLVRGPQGEHVDPLNTHCDASFV